MFFFNNTVPERCTVRRCKATNGFKNFFHFFKQTPLRHATVTPTKAYTELELLTFPPTRMAHNEFLTWLYIVKL